MISFNHPFLLLLLLFFPFFFLLKKSGLILSPELKLNLVNWKGVVPKKNKLMEMGNFLSYFLWYCGIVFLIIALAEPVSFKRKQVYTDAGSSIMFLLDISPSMAARDMNGETRIESAKKIIRKFAAKYPGDSFGLTALASSAALIVPPTIDHKVFLSRLNSLSIGELGEGTAIGMGLAVSAAYMSRSKLNSSYIILLTDGENNTGEINPKTAAEALINKNIGFYVIGIGNSGYASLEYTDKKTGKIYSGSIFSKFDEFELKKTAQYGNGKYASASSPDILETVFNAISKQVPATQSNFTQMIERNLYVYFLSASIFCFILVWLLRRIFMRVYL